MLVFFAVQEMMRIRTVKWLPLCLSICMHVCLVVCICDQQWWRLGADITSPNEIKDCCTFLSFLLYHNPPPSALIFITIQSILPLLHHPLRHADFLFPISFQHFIVFQFTLYFHFFTICTSWLCLKLNCVISALHAATRTSYLKVYLRNICHHPRCTPAWQHHMSP